MEGTRWEAICDTHGTLLWPEDDDLERAADLILEGAASRGGRPDDRSVALIRVTAAE